MRSLSVGDVTHVPMKPASPLEEHPVPPVPVCDFCEKSSESNKLGEYEELLFCKDCSAKGRV